MDAARAAVMSDPAQNRWFSRRWTDPERAPPIQHRISTDDPELDGLELPRQWRLERAQTREGSP